MKGDINEHAAGIEKHIIMQIEGSNMKGIRKSEGMLGWPVIQVAVPLLLDG